MLHGGPGGATALSRAVQLLDKAEAYAPLPGLPRPPRSFHRKCDRKVFESVWAGPAAPARPYPQEALAAPAAPRAGK
ncbi:hypothetical protein RBY4I_734 [Rhodobacterales bacterium Y4I]|nr:hypothetical protein RBY4I_734 [Rhodobacterales bacterium Y4I]